MRRWRTKKSGDPTRAATASPGRRSPSQRSDVSDAVTSSRGSDRPQPMHDTEADDQDDDDIMPLGQPQQRQSRQLRRIRRPNSAPRHLAQFDIGETSAHRLQQYRVRAEAAQFLRTISLSRHVQSEDDVPSLSPQTFVERGSGRLPQPLLERHHVAIAPNVSNVHWPELQMARIHYVSPKGWPMMTSCILPASIHAKPKIEIPDKVLDSRSVLKIPKGTSSFSKQLAEDMSFVPYNVLEDPNLHHGKHQKVLSLPSYTVSVSLYVKPADLKRELNAKFKEKFPGIDLTLSKLRSLKADLLLIGKQARLNVSTVAIAQFYFDQLVFSELVDKENRKVLPAACLVLAFKYNTPSKPSTTRARLQDIFKAVEDKWRLASAAVLHAEFPVYAALHFQLHVDAAMIKPYIEACADA